MKVVAENDDGADGDVVALLGHRQDADDEAVDEPVGLEQEPSLKGLDGDLGQVIGLGTRRITDHRIRSRGS
jgi:hypothetical protein